MALSGLSHALPLEYTQALVFRQKMGMKGWLLLQHNIESQQVQTPPTCSHLRSQVLSALSLMLCFSVFESLVFREVV